MENLELENVMKLKTQQWTQQQNGEDRGKNQ